MASSDQLLAIWHRHDLDKAMAKASPDAPHHGPKAQHHQATVEIPTAFLSKNAEHNPTIPPEVPSGHSHGTIFVCPWRLPAGLQAGEHLALLRVGRVQTQ